MTTWEMLGGKPFALIYMLFKDASQLVEIAQN